MTAKSKKFNTRSITTVAILSAVSSVLMMLSFSIPIMPGFIKFDFSELPALIASFSIGPWAGAAVCFVKNAINVFFSTTGGVGELSNLILGCCFVVPAGYIYKHNKCRTSAVVGALVGAFTMAFIGFFTNLFIVYPFYYSVMMPEEAVLSAYITILPAADTTVKALLIFNLPFTFAKGLVSTVISLVIYKKISPIIKGTWR